LPSLLLVLTFLSGLLDAASYTGLGHVFVSNMTGNVVILGLALGDAPKFSLPAVIAAVAAFAIGAAASGWPRRRFSGNRGLLLAAVAAAECVLVALALGLALSRSGQPGWRYDLAFTLPIALAMGAQNATATRLAVSGLSTTVLTTTLSGLAANAFAGGDGAGLGRRAGAVLAMLLGAAAGASLLRIGVVAVLTAALVALLVVAAVAYVRARAAPKWTSPS
jgi:uncharacterized membrane protein YoaK (UPF0700 family)